MAKVKMKVLSIVLLSFSAMALGCGGYPRTSEGQAGYFADAARKAIEQGNALDAGQNIDQALERQTGNARIKELFSSYSQGREFYWAYLERMINDTSSGIQSVLVLNKLDLVKTFRIFTDEQVNGLVAKLNKKVAEGNLSGSIPFTNMHHVKRFPVLTSSDHQKIIANRWIYILQQNNSSERQVKDLMQYVQANGIGSDEGKRIESLLPTLNIRRDELDVVAVNFPNFVAARKDALTLRVFLQTRGGDRLLKEDLLPAFRNEIKGIEWVTSPGPNTLTLTIERVRHNEKTIPEQAQTITYSQYQVDAFKAALLMPDNASYLYDVISGGAEIEYGYVLTAEKEGKPVFEEIVRGKAEEKYQRCQNARIQNVFGGVSSARFEANDDMRQRCSGTTATVSIENVRENIYVQLARTALKVPSISAVHNLN